jgi:hypothetical protein
MLVCLDASQRSEGCRALEILKTAVSMNLSWAVKMPAPTGLPQICVGIYNISVTARNEPLAKIKRLLQKERVDPPGPDVNQDLGGAARCNS